MQRKRQGSKVTESIIFADTDKGKSYTGLLKDDILVTVRIPRSELENFDRMRRELHDNCSRSDMIRDIVHYYCMAEEVLDAAEKG